MSEQSKEMALGYILKAMFDLQMNSKKLKETKFKALEIIEEQEAADGETIIFDNYSTQDLMVLVNRKLRMSDSDIDNISSELYYGFDSYTVEEAEEFYHAFATVLR